MRDSLDGDCFELCDNYEEEECRNYLSPEGTGCNLFVCNCSKVKWIGSNKYGNYYKCLVCGEESES